ncbi:hypothetical protein V8F20_005205 [Naviculisporaceae sp. PSN 640]
MPPPRTPADMPVHKSTEEMYPDMRVVGKYGWFHFDGQEFRSWGRHPRATEAELLALFDEPQNLSEQQSEAWKANARATLTWDFCAAQMRHYGHWFDSTMQRQAIMNCLRSKARSKLCRTVPKKVQEEENKLRAEWAAKFGNKGGEAPMASPQQPSGPSRSYTHTVDSKVGITNKPEMQPAHTYLNNHAGRPMDSEAQDKPGYHKVFPGQGLTASRWHDSAKNTAEQYAIAMDVESTITAPDVKSLAVPEQAVNAPYVEDVTMTENSTRAMEILIDVTTATTGTEITTTKDQAHETTLTTVEVNEVPISLELRNLLASLDVEKNEASDKEHSPTMHNDQPEVDQTARRGEHSVPPGKGLASSRWNI